jgi:hypothetical protein
MNESRLFCGERRKNGFRHLWKYLFLSLCLVVISNGRANPFRNFGFEEYIPQGGKGLSAWRLSTPSQSIPFSETNLPFGNPPSDFDGAWASIIDVSLFPHRGLDGKYALELIASSWTLSQRGDVPLDAKFLAWVSLGALPMELKIDGTVVPVDYFYDSISLYGIGVHAYAAANISAYAGKNVGLDLTTQGAPPFLIVPGAGYYSIIDSLTFSSVLGVPEPSTWVLIGLGGLALLWSRKKIRA